MDNVIVLLLIALLAHKCFPLMIGAIEGAVDQYRWEKDKKPPKHKKSFVWRSVFSVPFVGGCTYLFVLYTGAPTIAQIVFYVLSTCSDAALYLIALNVTFNLRDGREFDALGTTATTDKQLDEFWLWHVLGFALLVCALEFSLMLSVV